MMTAPGSGHFPHSPVEGMCPMAHFINVTCAVMFGPWYAFVCACHWHHPPHDLCMGIPGLSNHRAIRSLYPVCSTECPVVVGIAFAGRSSAIASYRSHTSYPVMTFVWGKTGLTWFFLCASFIAGTLIGGTIAFLF